MASFHSRTNRSRRNLQTTLLLCAAEVCGLSSLATFASLLPYFMDVWHISHTQAGWLSAGYYLGYVICVPILTAVTDRHDARAILLGSLSLGFAASVGFSLVAGGFWSALVLRVASGISLAGVYMPGLKLLSDHVRGMRQSRYISFYTASFSLGAGLSYFLTGEVDAVLGWRWAFAVAGGLNLLGMMLVWIWVPRGMAPSRAAPTVWLRFGSIFKRRDAMAYILAYAAHMWELFSMRAWVVAFLAYARHLDHTMAAWMTPTQVAALVNLIGLPASIGGNELCQRFGRRKTITWIMLASFCISLVVGFSAVLPYMVVVGIVIVYGIFVLGDSASLTAGAVERAPQGARGATLAVHSTLGFGAAFMGPLAVGVTLDLISGHPAMGWGGAFIVMGAGCVLGPLALRWGRIAGDHKAL